MAATICPWRVLCLVSFVVCSLVLGVGAGKRRCTIDDYRAGSPKKGFICGNQIPRTLSLVCGGRYRSPHKRDVGKYTPVTLVAMATSKATRHMTSVKLW